MRKKITIMILLFLIVAGAILVPVQSGILLTNLEGKPYDFFPWQGDRVTVGWRHTVELTPWKETYHINEDHSLSFESTIFQSYGAGTPDTNGKVEFLPDGFIRVTGITRDIPYYSLFYVPISHYYITDGTNSYPLKEYIPDYQHVQIHYETLNLVEWIRVKLTSQGRDGANA